MTTIPQMTMVIIKNWQVMKKFFNYFALAAIAALTLAGCSKNDQNAPEKEADALHIKVKANVQDLQGDPGTKTYISDKTIYWGTGEYMKIAVQGSSVKFATSSDASADWDGYTEAIFEFTLEEAPAGDSFKYMGMYPASAAVTANNTNPESYKVALPAVQNATASSYDPAAYIMIAKPEIKSAIDGEWEASYRRATALNKITLTNIPEDIVSVELTAPNGVYMAGRKHFNLTTGESGDFYEENTKTETIEVKANLSGTSKVVWFTSWETIIPAGAKFKIVVKSATKSYTRELTAKTGGISFKEGFLNTLNVNMASAEIGDLEDLSGNYLILAHNTNWYIMSTFNDYNYYNEIETSVTKNKVIFNDFESIENIGNYIWTVAKTEGGYSLKNIVTGKYLALTEDGNKAHSSDDPESFSLSIADDGVAIINSNVYSTRRLMHNAGNTRFAFYAGTMAPIYMIKAVHDSRTVVTLSFDEETVSKTTANYGEFTGQIPTSVPDVTAITDNIEYAFSGDAIGTVNATTGLVTLNGTEGSATITATFAGDEDYFSAEASYTINVTSSSIPAPETIVFAEWTPALQNDIQYTDPFNGGHFTITFAGGSNDGKYYTTGSGIRTYGGGSFTVASAYQISKIELKWSGDSNAPNSDVASPSGYSTETSSWTGESNSVTFTRPSGSGHWRLQKVTVVYKGYVAPKYTITIGTTSNGTISSDCEEAEEGATVTLTATPNSGYEFGTWDVKDANNNAIAVSGGKFTMPASNVTVTATFVEKSAGATVSMNSFTSISGYVDDDSNVSFLAEKGNAGTAPAVNNGEIRVYQNGGLFTVSANNGHKISSITIGSSMETTVTVTIDEGSASADKAISAGGTITESSINASSVKFTCTGTDKSHRLYVNYLSVTYE